MRHVGIDVGPEAVFGSLQLLPEAYRPLVGEGEADDRLDAFEAVFPRRYEPDRRAILLRHRASVGARPNEGELVRRLGHGEPLDIGPWIPELLLPRCDARIGEG